MKSEILEIYEEFFNSIENDKIEYIYEVSPFVDKIFNHIINCLEYYYDNSNTIRNDDPRVKEYFEDEGLIKEITSKVKYMISYINIVFYDICESDSNKFNTYIDIIYDLFLLEEIYNHFIINNFDADQIEENIQTINNLIYNNETIEKETIKFFDKKIKEYKKTLNDYTSTYQIFSFLNDILFGQKTSTQNINIYLEGIKEEFFNNLESFEELTSLIKAFDIYLYNKILKIENVILKLFNARSENTKLFPKNNMEMINALLIDITNMYNVYMCELDRVFDIYGIEFVTKYKDLIYYSSLIKDIVTLIDEITIEDEEYVNNYLEIYQSILDNNQDVFSEYVENGEDILNYLGEKYNMLLLKLENIIEDLYNKFIKQ